MRSGWLHMAAAPIFIVIAIETIIGLVRMPSADFMKYPFTSLVKDQLCAIAHRIKNVMFQRMER